MTSSQRTHPTLEVIHQASRCAGEVVEALADPEKSRDELCQALDEPQKNLAWDIIDGMKTVSENYPPVVWVNTYVRFSIEELPDSFSKNKSTDAFYIYQHTALCEEEDKLVQDIEDSIEHSINEEGETSLTNLINRDEEWGKILNGTGRKNQGIIKLSCDYESTDLQIETEDSNLKEAFDQKRAELSWYVNTLFREDWKSGTYIHISRPNFSHLPIDEAGVYMMARREGGLDKKDLHLFQLAYRSFLFEIVTARVWGIAQELDAQRKRRLGDLQDKNEKLKQQRRKLQRQENIFEKIEAPLNKLTERLLQVQTPLHEIQAALSPVEGFLFQGSAISRYFVPDGSVDFNDQFSITTKHDYSPGEPEGFKRRIAAILLTALQKNEEDDIESLWVFLQHILSNPSEDGRELTLEVDALRAVLPELFQVNPTPDEIERIFNSIKNWFCYGFEPGRDLYASFIHLALYMLIDNPSNNVDLERGDLRDCNLKACSEKPVDSIRALDKLNGAYSFNSATHARVDNRFVLKIIHDPQEQREEDLRDAKENLDTAQNIGRAGSSGNYEFTTTLYRLFGSCATQDVYIEEDETEDEWLVLQSADECNHDTSLWLKKGPQSCATKITWKESGGR